MQNWQYLKPGDIVDIIAPSSGVVTENLSEYYAKIKLLFASIGLEARIPYDLIDATKIPFCANSLEYRVNHIIKALQAKDSKAIWAIRGGYGAAKLIPFLERIEKPKTNKILLGFSDITALHLFFSKQWQFSTIHSCVVNQIMHNENFLNELKPILFGEAAEITYQGLTPLNEKAVQEIELDAQVIGGNLSIIQTSLASSWQICAENKIIFIEEVGEEGYRIDRMLNHLIQAETFTKARAIIFGEITPKKDVTPDLCGYAIQSFSQSIDIPVLSLPIIGHSIKSNSPLPFGTDCKLILGRNPKLKCLTGGQK